MWSKNWWSYRERLKNPSTYSSIDTDENIIQTQNSKLYKNQTVLNIKSRTPKLEKYSPIKHIH